MKVVRIVVAWATLLSTTIASEPSAQMAALAAEGTRLEFEYVNSPKGYTTTLTINSDWSISLTKVRKNARDERPTKVIKLNSKQIANVQTLLKGIHPDSLAPVYGLNFRATDLPSYVFRFPDNGKWKGTRINPYLSAPLAPAQLLALRDFLMQFVRDF